ncbi:hypothetical protein AWN76_016895 [Rhodothermaceae bacterium RA]|nr:hypothetical protein AWN76_016895 [Rhodothermaceae bacterium RA]
MWRRVPGLVVRGHGVASGRKNDPRFPGGTLRMQLPHFRARGLDLSAYYRGTINVCIAPHRYVVRRPRCTFRHVRWHPTEPAEDFSFFDTRLETADGRRYPGLIYYPHPETKPEHVQPPDVLEVLTVFIPGLRYGDPVHLETDPAQLDIVIREAPG